MSSARPTYFWSKDKKVCLTRLIKKHTNAATPEEFRKLKEEEFEGALREMIEIFPVLQYSRMVRNFERLCRDKEIHEIFAEAFPSTELYASDLKNLERLLHNSENERFMDAERYRLIETVTDVMKGIINDINFKFAGDRIPSQEMKRKTLDILDIIYGTCNEKVTASSFERNSNR